MELTSFLSAVLLWYSCRFDWKEEMTTLKYIMRINLPEIVFHDSDSKNQDPWFRCGGQSTNHQIPGYVTWMTNERIWTRDNKFVIFLNTGLESEKSSQVTEVVSLYVIHASVAKSILLQTLEKFLACQVATVPNEQSPTIIIEDRRYQRWYLSSAKNEL